MVLSYACSGSEGPRGLPSAHMHGGQHVVQLADDPSPFREPRLLRLVLLLRG